MAGILTTSAGATTFRSFLNGDHFSPLISIKSPSNLHIPTRIVPKASLHAVIDEPVIESIESKKTKSSSLYDVLRVNRNATVSEIKSAYRSLAKRYHPDANGSKNNDCEFIEIYNAYATLIDSSTRALYDLKLSNGIQWRSGRLYAGAGICSEFYSGQRWETDQCW